MTVETLDMFGPDYIWNDSKEFSEAVRRMQMTPYQMAREFRETFGQPLDVCDVVESPDDDMAITLIEEEFGEVYDAWIYEPEDGSEAVLKELADLVYVAYGYAALRGWNLDKAVARVHLSNMSKCDPVTGEPIRREDGKVLKGPHYKPPYLKDLV